MSKIPIFNAVRIIPRDQEFLDRKLGAFGEIFYDRDSNSLRLYDGKAAGGIALSKADLSNVNSTAFREKSVDAKLATVVYTVTVAGPQAPDTGNKYNLNSVYRLSPNFVVGYTYVFVQDDATNVYFPNATGTTANPHPLNFSSDNLSGELGDGTSYLDDVRYFLNGASVTQAVYNGAAFNTAVSRQVRITVTNATPATLYYWCYNHQAMGAAIAVADPGSGSGIAGSSVAVSISAPASPEPGNLWLDTATGILYVYFNDGDSQQWIQPVFPYPDISGLATETYVDTAISSYALLNSPTFTGTVGGITATMVGLGNVTNESKDTMFDSPTFTGTVGGITATMVGLGNVTNESKDTMFDSPTFVTPALGTPASGVVTNLTGTASININGTVGAATASTGSFTTLAASSTLAVTGAGTIQGLTVGRGAGAIATNTAVGLSALAANTTGGNNTATGFEALFANTTGIQNTANGVSALFSNTTGNNNTATGFEALRNNTIGNFNTANGRDALRNNTTGSSNTANGQGALRSNTTGASNTANGQAALANNTTGGSNTANGLNALLFNTTGTSNTANGRDALRVNTTGDQNTATGREALLSNTTGASNTANGQGALRSNTTGIQNTANGVNALLNNTTGGSNTANGVAALSSNTTGSFNTANGSVALFANTTGINNTATGRSALQDNTTGNNNIGIGLNAGRSTSPRTITTQSNEICLGNNDHTGAFIRIAFTVTSDARDKAALAPIPHGLDFVNALLPTEYQFKAGGRDGAPDGKRRYGFLAQDVLTAEGKNPVIINNDDPDSLKMTSDYLIPVLVNAMKELTEQVNTLKAELATLKGN